jgi:hypothetical protein
MADNPALDGFLAAGAQPAQDGAQPPEPQPAPEPPAKPDTPPREPEKPAREAKEPEAETEDEALAHVQGGDNRTVPFSALEKVRNDWKSKAAAEKAKADLLAQQLEEFKRQATAPAPPSPPQQQMPAPPDPRVDPVGAMQYLYTQQQHMLLNERLNNSEAFVRDKMGEDLDKYVAEFKDAAGKDQALWGKLYGQPAPYQWLVKEMDRRRAQADIGDDPAAFRSRVEAELRAKWEQEVQGQMNGGNGRTVTVSPAAGMAPSLANARSVAGRSVPAFTGPPPMDELFPGNHRRQQPRR